MYALQEVEEGGMVGFHAAGEDRGADHEDVGALGEEVVAGGGDDGFAEFAHGAEEGREFGCGW